MKMIIDIIKKADRLKQCWITERVKTYLKSDHNKKFYQNLNADMDMDLIYGYYLQYYLENDDVEVLDSKELEKEIKKSGFDVRDGKIIRNEQFNQLIQNSGSFHSRSK